MSAQDLLAELARLDVKVKAGGGNLSYDAPKGTVTPSLLSRLKEHKAEILSLLKTPPAATEDRVTRDTTEIPKHPADGSRSERPCHHGVPGGCWLCKKYGLKPPVKKGIQEVLKNPPYWIRGAYIPGYQCGNISLEVLAVAVAAELGHSPYEVANSLLKEVKAALLMLPNEKEDRKED